MSTRPGRRARSSEDRGRVKIGLRSWLGLVRTGGLYTIAVVCSSLTAINLMLAFSLFS